MRAVILILALRTALALCEAPDCALRSLLLAFSEAAIELFGLGFDANQLDSKLDGFGWNFLIVAAGTILLRVEAVGAVSRDVSDFRLVSGLFVTAVVDSADDDVADFTDAASLA